MPPLGKEGDDEGDGPASAPPLRPSRPRGERSPKTPKTRTKSESVSREDKTSREIGAIARAIGEAHANGASAAAHLLDSTQTSLGQLMGLLVQAQATIAARDQQIATLQANNPTIALLHSQAENTRLDTVQKWETIRALGPEAMKSLGPHAGPFLKWGAKKLGITDDAPTPDSGDASPRAATLRVLKKMQDGSEHSVCVTGILMQFIEEDCHEDPATVLGFLVSAVQGPGPAPAPAGGGAA